MYTSSKLLAKIKQLTHRTEGWEKEVNYNWVRQFAYHLVCLMNPHLALQYISIAKYEFLMPKGIIEINRILDNKLLDEDNKIRCIKGVLLAKGYDGTKETNIESWLRTDVTHGVYCQMAKYIKDYEQHLPELVVIENSIR